MRCCSLLAAGPSTPCSTTEGSHHVVISCKHCGVFSHCGLPPVVTYLLLWFHIVHIHLGSVYVVSCAPLVMALFPVASWNWAQQIWCFSDRASWYRLFQITNLMHNSFILQQHVCYTTILNMFWAARRSSSGGQIVSPQPLVSSPSVNSRTVCTLRADCSPLSTCILYGCLQRVTIPEAVVIQFVLLTMSSLLLETWWGS